MNIRNPALPFFLLPFFIMAGVALQSAGLYLLLVLWLFTAGQPLPASSRRVMLSTASLLIMVYLIPVVLQSIVAIGANPLQYCFIDPPRVTVCKVDLRAWFKSPASSAFLGLGMGWGLYVLTRKPILGGLGLSSADVSTLNIWNDDSVRLRGFAIGLLYATVLLFSYCLYQHFTGFSLLLKSKFLAQEHRMPNGTFRVFGFYGHPLSMAGAALVWSALAIFGLWTTHRTRSDKMGLALTGWGTIALLQSALVYMSGGRTALLVLAVFWIVLVCAIVLSLLVGRLPSFRKSLGRKHVIIGAVAAFGAAIILALIISLPLLQQFADKIFARGMGGGSFAQGPLGDRELFWQVYLAMWRDAPVLGQGYFAVEHGLRTHFYVKQGFADLVDKFNAHNIFLEILGISGLVGFFAYLLVCVLLWINMSALAGKSQQRRFILGGLGVAFIANCIHGLTQNTFFDSAVTSTYLALIGVLVVPPLKELK